MWIVEDMLSRNLHDEKVSEIHLGIENYFSGGAFLVNNKPNEMYINILKIKFDDMDELELFIGNCQKYLLEMKEKAIEKI